MTTALALLIPLLTLLAIVSLVLPQKGMFWALPQHRTRIKGFCYWGVVTVATLFLFAALSADESMKDARVTGYVLAGILWLSAYYLTVSYRSERSKKQSDTDAKTQTDQKKQEQTATQAQKAGYTVTVKSHSSPKKTYECDLDNVTCTCPDWTGKRHVEPVNSPARLCKHLVGALAAEPDHTPEELTKYLPLIEFHANEGSGVYHFDMELQTKAGHTDDGEIYLITRELGAEWANLYFRGSRYGYNAIEERWSYKKEPDKAQRWAELMQSC